MIVGMRKLHLAALSYDRDAVLNALERTRAVEIKEHAETEATSLCTVEREGLADYLSSLEEALGIILAHVPEGNAADLKDGFEVSYTQFLAAKDFRPRAEELIRETARLTEEKAAADGEVARLTREIAAVKPYTMSAVRFSKCHDTRNVAVRLGLVSAPAWDALQKQLDELPLAAYEATMSEEGVLLLAVCHRESLQTFESLLSAASFSSCPYTGERTGAELSASLERELQAQRERASAAEEGLAALASEVRPLKIYCDYVGFELEKAEACGKMQATAHAVFMEAFVPADGEETVKAALDALGIPLFCEFSDPAEDEFIPTLTRNNKIVSNFETVTNMYSAPNARELDPNTVMSFFYSLFLGFIMADMGYGLMMMLGGFFIWKKKKGDIASLGGVFGIGGVFALLWGILFNSLFGERVLPFTLMPDAQTAMYSLAGIDLPAVLIIALLLGIFQLCAGYLCKFAQCVHRKRPWDGVFDGLVWAVFSLGAFLAVVGLTEDFGMPVLAGVGGVTAGVSLLVAVCTAGRHERLLGKFTKGFGSLYGLINYFTDVLSYIRLYGLMLTGAVIAQVISDYSLQFIASGSVLIVLGVVLMVVGHVFNLAISLLGAYIHTARLQYVEFFGRFYEGEGRLFDPLGSHAKYISLELEKRAQPPQEAT